MSASAPAFRQAGLRFLTRPWLQQAGLLRLAPREASRVGSLIAALFQEAVVVEVVQKTKMLPFPRPAFCARLLPIVRDL